MTEERRLVLTADHVAELVIIANMAESAVSFRGNAAATRATVVLVAGRLRALVEDISTAGIPKDTQ